MTDERRFAELAALFAEVKRDKAAGTFRDPEAWLALVPDAVKASFEWPTEEERARWLAVRDSTPIYVEDAADVLGEPWDFYAVFEAFENGEYELLACEHVGDGLAQLTIEPFAYPYGGAGPLIALVEAFGFRIVGVNEYGEYVPV